MTQKPQTKLPEWSGRLQYPPVLGPLHTLLECLDINGVQIGKATGSMNGGAHLERAVTEDRHEYEGIVVVPIGADREIGILIAKRDRRQRLGLTLVRHTAITTRSPRAMLISDEEIHDVVKRFAEALIKVLFSREGNAVPQQALRIAG